MINIVHSGLNKLTDYDKQCIKYEIKESDSTISLYIYKTIPSTNQLNILRLSDHLPSMQKLIRGNTAPRPSVIENSNVSIDFYKPKRIIQVDTAGNAKVKKVPNRFDNYVGVPSNIPQVEPFTVSSFQYFYKDLDQSDEMILWHSIATWVCCLDPNKEYHDPFASDETKMAKTETKTAEVHVFGDKIEITENKQYNNMNKKQIRLTESDLKQLVKESVNKILSEAYGTMPNNDAYDITGLDAANDEGAHFSPLGKFNDVPLDSLIDLNKAVKLFNNDYNYLQFINPNYARALRKHLYYVDEYLDNSSFASS